jgi:DNA-binding NarL/FixJ family response regulator
MDVRMPGVDDIEPTGTLLAEGDTAPRVLMLTTFDIDEYVYDALSAGASGFLLEDVTAERLFDAVRTIAAGDALLAPTVTAATDQRVRAAAPTTASTTRPAACADPTRERRPRLIAEGLSNHSIADRPVVSGETVRTHVSRILTKLGLRTAHRPSSPTTSPGSSHRA